MEVPFKVKKIEKIKIFKLSKIFIVVVGKFTFPPTNKLFVIILARRVYAFHFGFYFKVVS